MKGSQPLRGLAGDHDAARRVCGGVQTGGRGGHEVTDDDRRFQAGYLHQAVDLIGDVLLRDRLALALAVSGQVDREARHRVAEPVDDRLPDSPVEGQPVHEHGRRASAAGNGDATSTRPARTSARSPAWISRTKSGMSGRLQGMADTCSAFMQPKASGGDTADGEVFSVAGSECGVGHVSNGVCPIVGRDNFGINVGVFGE